MKKSLMYAFAVLAMASCGTQKNIYQVYDVEAPGMVNKGNALVYDTPDVRLSYNLCAEGGNLDFAFTNKTEHILFVVLPESFFIRNGSAYDYYEESEYSSSTTSTTGASAIVSEGSSLTGLVREPFVSNRWYLGSITRTYAAAKSAAFTNSKSVTTHAPKYVAVPPRSTKVVRGFTIYDTPYLQCGIKMGDVNYPRKHTSRVEFTHDNTPLEFVNYICYTPDPDKRDQYAYVENTFYIASMQNIHENEVLVKNPNYSPNAATPVGRNADACAKKQTPKIFTIKGAAKFYNSYKSK